MGVMGTYERVPYPGARPFEQNDQDIFFGRSEDASELACLWLANSLTVAVGPVASGKTSLLNAGVYPLVRQGNARTLPLGRASYGETFPSAALPEHNPYSLALLRSWSPWDSATRLVGHTVRDFIHDQAERSSGVILAAIDQIEVLLSDSGPRRQYSRRFLAELADALRHEPRLHLLLIGRDEAADLISQALGSGVRHEVKTLTVKSAVEAVTGPLARTGCSITDEAAHAIVTDLRTRPVPRIDGPQRYTTDDRVEPSLLQVACVSLWRSLPSHVDEITQREVRFYGDVSKALVTYWGQVISSVADEFELPPARLHSWLIDNFVTEYGTSDTAYEGAQTTAGLPNAVARAMADRYLFITELRSGTRWYRLLTDRLIGPLRQAADELVTKPNAAARLSFAEKALARGDLDAAERYAKATSRASKGTDVLLRAEVESLLGNVESERGEHARAEEHYREAARLYELLQDPAAVASQLAATGQALMAQERPEQAVDEFNLAISRMPNDPVMQSDLSTALWQIGDCRAAVAVLTRVLHIDGANSLALRVRGEILADLGDAREAMLDLDRVTLHGHPETRAARALALALLGDRIGADREIQRAIAEGPRSGTALLRAARASQRSGDEAYAEQLARRAVDATDPLLPPYHREVALRLAGHKERNLSHN
jgi:tetratricopeptide (TPR) repeat protein